MAANESRRRADPVSHISKIAEGSIVSQRYIYQALNQNVDCTRFVKIEPTDNDKDPTVCTLLEIAFAERPKFEALSYMWGDESIKKLITLDGLEFPVGENLYDALNHLRKRAKDTLFWIDALSINQSDIEERNRQLHMMSHIYFRASTVVIWLGKKYLRYQGQLSVLEPPPPVNPSITGSHMIPTLDHDLEGVKKEEPHERKMVQELIKDGYWNRLWIIQEIGRARKKQVCFGNLDMTWDNFIHFVTLHGSSGSEGPLKMAHQLREKNAGAHKFRRLLEDHQRAECKEPRDKIYGLVGLAVDVVAFPMDYNKSLMEVWTDTMEFLNKHRLFNDRKREADIIYFGELLRFQLMKTNLTPLQQLLRPYTPGDDSNLIIDRGQRPSSNPKVFELKAYVLGAIGFIGPSSGELVANLSRADEWKRELQRGFPGDIDSASSESDVLMSKILDSDSNDLHRLCSSHISSVRFVQNGGMGYYIQYQESRDSTNFGQQRPTSIIDNQNPCLYQIHHSNIRRIPWKMGITSTQAQRGDLICWVAGTRKAFVVRLCAEKNGNNSLQIVGTALATDDLASTGVNHEARLS